MNVQELKESIKAGADIVSVIGRFIKLKRASQEWVAVCPFHVERSPSFSVNRKKQIFKCFGCGASGDVIEFVQRHQGLQFMEALNLIANIESIQISFENDGFQPKKPGQKQAPEIKTVEKEVLQKTLKAYEANSLALFLADRFGVEQSISALLKYATGTAKNGFTVFWQIDQFQRIRTAQKIKYLENGHRDKNIPPKRLFTVDQGYQPCFFGEHLLFQAGREDLVCIVESEKTAIVADLYFPEMQGRKCFWIAAGGNNGITESKAAAIRGMNVCLVPDFSWLSRAVWGLVPMKRNDLGKIAIDGIEDPDYISRAAMLEKMGCKVSFFDPCPDRTDNADLADILLELPAPIQEPDFSSLTLPA
jgi:hypothetical protein